MFGTEPISRVFEDGDDLILQHFAEVRFSIPEDHLVLAYDRLNQLDRDGKLVTFTVRERGALVGYCVLIIGQSLHDSQERHAYQDALYLRPDMRRGSLGMDFIRWCDEQLASMGVDVVHQMVPAKGRDFGPVLTRIGYEQSEIVYTRRL